MSLSEASIEYSGAGGPRPGKRKSGGRVFLLALIPALAAALVAVLLPRGVSNAATTPEDFVSPPSDSITLDVKSVNGSGCAKDTYAVAMSEDNTAFTVTYSDFLAQTGVDAKRTDFRKNCQLNLVLSIPQGFTYAIAQADYRGFAALEEGASGTMKASYYFQGMSQTVSSQQDLQGPYEDNWQKTDRMETAALVFKPCGEERNVNINTELRVNPGTSDTDTTTSFMTMDSTDLAVSTIFRIQWAECGTS